MLEDSYSNAACKGQSTHEGQLLRFCFVHLGVRLECKLLLSVMLVIRHQSSFSVLAVVDALLSAVSVVVEGGFLPLMTLAMESSYRA